MKISSDKEKNSNEFEYESTLASSRFYILFYRFIFLLSQSFTPFYSLVATSLRSSILFSKFTLIRLRSHILFFKLTLTRFRLFLLSILLDLLQGVINQIEDKIDRSLKNTIQEIANDMHINVFKNNINIKSNS